jgi:hypothetical protein
MSTAPSGALPGLLLPPGVVQPIFLRYRRDDLHVMAFMEGHPDYEAVEAMVQSRPGGRYAIRAIITRHDQSQIDHVNDDELIAEMRGAEREVCRREVDFAMDPSGATPRARLAFTSMAHEEIVLELTTLDRPQPSRAGLTDPGGHSAEISLPLMWRGASTLAGPATHVMIDGVRHDAPRYVGGGPLDARKGYFTERHAMGVVRAGTLAMKVTEAPFHLRAGAQWAFEVEGREVRYRATDDEGGLRIEGPDGETVIARPHGDRLAVSRISVPAQGDPTNCLVLTLDPAGAFDISMEGQRNLVAGRATTLEAASGAIFTLDPREPNWAVARKVRTEYARAGDRLTFITTIGG